MNKRSLGWLHPAVIYLILLILVIVVLGREIAGKHMISSMFRRLKSRSA